ncbi:MAG TPA: cell division protein FtsW [Candidatus Wolfebacteria bacterium]|nr:cell division protein FtsW [Candidatus Wolfebacteria bacterium]
MFKNSNKIGKGHNPDYFFILCIVLLTIFGLVMLSSASSDLGKKKFDDTFYYLKHQLIYGLSLGIFGFLAASGIYYRKLERYAVPFLIINIVLLILIFTNLGSSHGLATRWLDLGFFSFQPAELLKFTFIIYLAAWLSNKKINRQTSFLGGWLPFLVICGVVAFLVFKQPATTTVLVVLASALILYFISGARLSFIVGTLLLGILAVGILISSSPYRFERVKSFLNKESVNIQAEGFHQNQALIAIGTGGFWGVGFGQSTTKFRYLPEPIGDSIFAVIAEELGFIGALILITVFVALIIRGFLIAKHSQDQFAKLIVVGLTSIIAIQVFVHIAAISGLIPLTGVPLPFISYGGTALAIFLTMSGVIVNISKYTS